MSGNNMAAAGAEALLIHPGVQAPRDEAPRNESTFTERSIRRVGKGVGSLTKLLPTGTVFLFQFLNPYLTNNGQCNTLHKCLSGFLIAICAFFCCFSSFTDSYTGTDELTHYVIVTKNGINPSTNAGEAVEPLSFWDGFHATLSLIVFAALALLDSNTVECFYPSFESAEKDLIIALPLVVGAVSGAAFACLPTTRHGIGYPQESS